MTLAIHNANTVTEPQHVLSILVCCGQQQNTTQTQPTMQLPWVCTKKEFVFPWKSVNLPTRPHCKDNALSYINHQMLRSFALVSVNSKAQHTPSFKGEKAAGHLLLCWETTKHNINTTSNSRGQRCHEGISNFLYELISDILCLQNIEKLEEKYTCWNSSGKKNPNTLVQSEPTAMFTFSTSQAFQNTSLGQHGKQRMWHGFKYLHLKKTNKDKMLYYVFVECLYHYLTGVLKTHVKIKPFCCHFIYAMTT